MTTLLSIWRIIIFGLRNFARNAWLSAAATVVMTITLLIVITSYLSTSALDSTIQSITNKLDVSVYLNDSVTGTQLTDLEAKFKAVPNVAEVKYISKADALASYEQANAGNTKLLQAISITNNPLPASLEIKAKDPNHFESIAAVINESDVKALQSDPASYSGDRKVTIDKIASISNFIKKAGLIGSIIFVVISTLIIFNTIRMAIFTRRDEIEIEKLIGATKWFIRGPFLFEAALYGIIAAIIATSLGYAIALGGLPALGSYVDVSSTISIFRTHIVEIVGIEIIIGILIGMGSSTLAMIRYLKLQ